MGHSRESREWVLAGDSFGSGPLAFWEAKRKRTACKLVDSTAATRERFENGMGMRMKKFWPGIREWLENEKNGNENGVIGGFHSGMG